jgi:hypothetical protein
VEQAQKANSNLYKYKSATISGSYLWHHDLTNHLKPGALGLKKPFDVVILQGHSAAHTTPEKHENFVKNATEFNELIKATGAKTALFMTWAYTKKDREYLVVMKLGAKPVLSGTLQHVRILGDSNRL